MTGGYMSGIMHKKVLRSTLRNQRKSLDPKVAADLSRSIQDRCMTLQEWIQAKTVHVYVSAVDNEVHTEMLISDLLHRCGSAVVPLCRPDDTGLYNIRIESRSEMAPGHFGLLEPVYDHEKTVPPEDIDLVVAPLLGFDREGGRLGLGGGFYDSLLSQVQCPVAGLAYAMQEVEHVPREEHDMGLDIIVTEREIIRVDNG